MTTKKRKYKPKAVVVDYDDTVVDFTGFLCYLHNKKHGTTIGTSDITDWDFTNLSVKDVRGNVVLGSELKETFKYYEEDGLYAALPVIKESKFALELIKKLGYHIIVLTARPEKFKKQTEMNLIMRDVPYDELYFDWDKVKKIKEFSKLYNIVLFADDKLTTVESVSDNCRVKYNFLIDKPHNKCDNIDNDELIRIADLLEAVRYLKEVK